MVEYSGYYPADDGRLHYLQWGTGRRLLLAFHGYGDDATIFAPMLEYLVADYTIVSINLPYHGGSQWTEGHELTNVQLAALVTHIMAAHQAEQVSLLGYSLGGRVALSIVEQLPEKTAHVTLLAPDGLTVDPYFFFFMNTPFGRTLFRNMMEQPQPYLKAINLLKNWKLVHQSRYKFAMHFLQTEESRQFLLHVWPAMRRVMPDGARLRKAIRDHHIPIDIFMGRHDKIMPPGRGFKFKDGLATAHLHLLEKGHRVLDNETAQQIAASLL